MKKIMRWDWMYNEEDDELEQDDDMNDIIPYENEKEE